MMKIKIRIVLFPWDSAQKLDIVHFMFLHNILNLLSLSNLMGPKLQNFYLQEKE